MADEAVVRIVLDGGGGGTKTPAPTPTSSGTAPTPPPPNTGPQPPPPPQRDWINDLVNGIAGANRHVLIEGQSGSGKSLLTKHIAFERMAQGEEVNVVDTHTPEAWAGAKQVFQGTNEQASTAAAKFLRETLESRKAESQAAKLRGETVDFQPMTIVFSDFARLIKDSPELQKELQTSLTEFRKFNVAIVADTTALTGAATGIKGIVDVANNFAQRVKLTAPTATEPHRTATMGAEKFETPVLPDYQDRTDYNLVKPSAPVSTVEPPFDPLAVAKERIKREEQRAAAEAEYRKLKPPEPLPPFDPYTEAVKRREGERRAAQVREAYKNKYGGSESDILGKAIDAATQFRGVIGGVGGTIVGALLDTTAAVRRAQSELNARKKDKALLAEAGGVASGVPSTVATSGGSGTAEAGAAGAGATGTVSGAEAGGAAVVEASVAVAAAAVAGIAVVVAESISVMGNAVNKYAEYNPEIAQAQAQAEIGTMLADMMRSEQYSKQLVEFTAAQFEMQQKWEEVKMKFMAAIEPAVVTIMVGLGNVADFLGVIIDIIQKLAKWVGLKDDKKKADEVNDPADDIYEGSNPFENWMDVVKGI